MEGAIVGEEDVLTRAMAAVLRVHADRYGDADAIKVLLDTHRVIVRVISEAGLDPNAKDGRRANAFALRCR